jgi:microcystin-dependent protein
MSWPTGNTISTERVAVRFLVPNDAWIRQSLMGAMLALETPFSWDYEGDIDPRIAAAMYRVVMRTVQVQSLTVGQIVCFPADDMQYIGQDPLNGPSQWRKCDGASYLKADFPDCYAVIGDTFGADSTHFSVPDMRGRVLVDAGNGTGLSAYSLGDTFGEESHTLSSGEMPSHSHSESGAVSTLINGGLEAPASAAVPTTTVTGNTGGGGAHENRQPSIALFYYIQVEL